MRNRPIILAVLLLAVLNSCSDRSFRQIFTKYNGISVSHLQGIINWKTVSRNPKIQFVYIKASHGASRMGRLYPQNIRNARKNGLKCGSYHYFTSRSHPQKQFDKFKRCLELYEQDLIPVIDVEETNGNYKSTTLALKEFMRLFENEYGFKPIIYCSYRMYCDFIKDEFGEYKLFLARCDKDPGVTGYTLWQYTKDGKMRGIPGSAYLSRFGKNVELKDILWNKPETE